MGRDRRECHQGEPGARLRLERRLSAMKALEPPGDVRVVQLAKRSRSQARVLPLEKRDPEKLLKDANLLTNRTGRHVKRLGSGYDAPVTNDGVEYLQGSKRRKAVHVVDLANAIVKPV